MSCDEPEWHDPATCPLCGERAADEAEYLHWLALDEALRERAADAAAAREELPVIDWTDVPF